MAVDTSGFSIATLLGVGEGLATGSAHEALPGTGRSGPTGIESVLEYNGAFINVRDWIDTYLVTTIGGLDDADVRDSREVNPGYHGETPFKGYYGGRTITLGGKIYAKTLFKLRDMQQGLRQAFSQLENELPLIFRTPDPEFDMMINCKKSQALQMAEEQRTANHFERNFQITLRASNPRFLSVVKVHNSFSFANAYDFTKQRTVIKETFDDPSVLNLYNIKGDAFKVAGSKLVSNGKDNLTNLIKNPDFDAAVTTHSIVTTNCRLSQSLSGGVDDGPYCVIDADSNLITMEWQDMPVTAGKYYSFSMWVRAEAGSTIHCDVEWRTAASFWAARPGTPDIPATGQWQEIKLENLWAIDDPTPANDTVAVRLRLVIFNTNVGGVHGVDKVMFVNGTTLPVDGYFDGSFPKAYWNGGTAYVGTSTMFPYTTLTTNRLFTQPMMTAKVNIAAIDATHPWSGQDVYPEGLRIVLAYIDEGNQIFVTYQDKPASATGRFVFVIWRNGEMETYSSPGLMNSTVSNFNAGDTWWRAYLKNGEAVIEWWRVDPYSGVTDGYKEYDYIKLTPEQSALFEQEWPMQLVIFDQQYIDSGNIRQDTWRLDEFTYQSVDDLDEWDNITSTAGILNGTPATYAKSSVYVNNNKLYQLWSNASFLLRNDLPSLVGDGSITMKVRYDDPIGSSMIQVGIIGKYVDSSNFIYADLQIYNTTNMTIHISTPFGMAGGFANYLDFVKTDFPEDTDRWLRLVMNGNTFTVEFWTTDPALGGAALRTRSGTLTGAAIAKLGTGVKGKVGLVVSSMVPSASIDDYVVAQTTFNDTAISAKNNGNFRAQPVIELSGPLTNPVLTNEANDEVISIPTTIPTGEVWVLDIEDRRMYRKSDQANRFQYLDANSDWMELEPGENPISMVTSGTAVASQVNIDFHHTVM